MKEELLRELRALSREERENLEGEGDSHRALYAKSGRFIIHRRQMSELIRGEETAAVSLRPHPRFREFPVHTHDYVELMYVCEGSITHRIGNVPVRLEKDDLILLSRHASHSIEAAGAEDIGFNVILSADLFESIFHSLRHHSRLSGTEFEGLIQKDGLPFCVFHAAGCLPICNLMESMIASSLSTEGDDPYILQQSVALLLCHLAAMNREQKSHEIRSDRERMMQRLSNYLCTSYSTATLTEASRMLGLTPPYLSRFTKNAFGKTFKELLMEERFSAACSLLSTTTVPIGEIVNQVGYENSSYFHKEFKKRFSITPKEYRQNALKSRTGEQTRDRKPTHTQSQG